MKKLPGLFCLVTAFCLIALCATAQAQYDMPDAPLYHDENLPEFDENFPEEDPAFHGDDFQPDAVDPRYEGTDDELLRDLETDTELPPYDDSPGGRDEDFPTEEMPADEPDFDIPPDMMPGDSDSDMPFEDAPSLELSPAGPGGGALSPQATPAKCSQAAGRVIILLNSQGIHSGVTYLKPGARVEFSNQSNVTHKVKISPAGFFTSSNFTITPHSKVLMFAGSPSTVTGGSIVVNPGSGQTVLDAVICP